MGLGQTQSPEPIESLASEESPIVTRLTQGLAECDWDQLQEKYTNAMDEHSRVEEELRAETARLLEVFTAWSQTTVLQDEKRALKRCGYPLKEANVLCICPSQVPLSTISMCRFKTQMQHVQNSEVSVENKKKHYNDVVKAFQNALALLNEQTKS
ncbi:hypothetical protein N7532_006109 [Penicillium argentinense]|uniref:Uncharacterized protein n=1 Tax=Penicillium argentinense TaxID=1131581 RepID=A0A9W9FF62_9EURO|nr:uncharacterized protein N7532_006109 [Penicillium argentinense]KAJ5099108.1 hypothetical protein N7532_006109 [Penicillium argentinense]